VEALPEIIAALKEKGYTFVTVHELLGISPPPRR
jgi:peptidoglycan/xylan/chitin deacetylase (PgdA/CDA1 family)